MPEPAVRVTALGGLGEIGMNCLVLECGDSMVVVDCGLMFPDDYLFGIDVVIPRFDYVLANKERLAAIILTHGHEDHIGALPWFLPYVSAPIYGSAFTLGLVNEKLKEHNLDKYADLRTVAGRQTIAAGAFRTTFFETCHSIVGGFALGMETPAGRILHTGDFKIDRNPLDNIATDLEGIREFCAPGVLLMLSDSTNVERDGFALTEREIKGALRRIFGEAKGRILVTLFSSHIQRMQEIYDLAAETGRKVAVTGRSISRNIELASDLGLMRIPHGATVPMESLPGLRDEQVALLVTGSQGEPLSALSRIAAGDHRQISIRPGDLVLMSSRFIPGNVKAITKVINRLYKLGAEVLYERVQAIHASGHAHREELKIMLQTVRPKFFAPVHGEYRHLVKHSRLAVECGVAPERALVIEDGQPFTLTATSLRLEEAIPVESILVDGKGVGDVGQTVLKERQLLGGEGLVVVVLVLDAKTGEILRGPDVTSKGFVFEQQYSHLLEDARCVVLDIYENVPPGDTDKLKERIRSSLRRFFRRIIDRDPVVEAVVIAI